MSDEVLLNCQHSKLEYPEVQFTIHIEQENPPKTPKRQRLLNICIYSARDWRS